MLWCTLSSGLARLRGMMYSCETVQNLGVLPSSDDWWSCYERVFFFCNIGTYGSEPSVGML